MAVVIAITAKTAPMTLLRALLQAMVPSLENYRYFHVM